MEGDVKLTPISAVASELQPGYGIEHTYDGKFDEKHYHSPWGQEAHFPVTLEYEFDGTRDLDYILTIRVAATVTSASLRFTLLQSKCPSISCKAIMIFKCRTTPAAWYSVRE